MNRKVIVTIILVIIVILVFASFRLISFSQTTGVVLDETGKPVADAKVSISYSCRENKGFVDSDSHSFKTRTIQTDSDGRFSFESFGVGFASRIKYPASCEKIISAFKEGYCRDIQLCTREITTNGITKEQIGKYEAIKSELLYRNGLYYESAYFLSSISINSDQEVASLNLTKFDLWFQ